MSELYVKEVETKAELKQFINLPWVIYEQYHYWVPPLKIAIHDILNPKHPFYETAKIKHFIAIKDRLVVGRCSAVIPYHYNQFHQSNVGFFGFFESSKNPKVAHLLLKKVEDYLKAEGLDSVLGPFNPSTNYEAGLLVEGFDDPPQIMMTYNPKYYQTYIEENGYQKAKDLQAIKIDSKTTFSDTIKKIAQRAEKRNKITYRFLDKKQFEKEVETMLLIYNDAWEKNWGFVPMSEKEFKHTAKDLKMIVDERLVLFAEVAGEPAGFVVGLPDLNQVFKKIPNGSLFPFGIFKLLNYKKTVNRMRVPTLGVRRKFHNLGLGPLLYQKIQESNNSIGKYQEVEASWILEDNQSMQKGLKHMNGKVYKNYRIYQKELS